MNKLVGVVLVEECNFCNATGKVEADRSEWDRTPSRIVNCYVCKGECTLTRRGTFAELAAAIAEAARPKPRTNVLPFARKSKKKTHRRCP